MSAPSSDPLAGWERREVAMPPDTWAMLDVLVADFYTDMPEPFHQAVAMASSVGVAVMRAAYTSDSDLLKATLQGLMRQAEVSRHAAAALDPDPGPETMP